MQTKTISHQQKLDVCNDWLPAVAQALPVSCGFNKVLRRMSCDKTVHGDMWLCGKLDEEFPVELEGTLKIGKNLQMSKIFDFFFS